MTINRARLEALCVSMCTEFCAAVDAANIVIYKTEIKPIGTLMADACALMLCSDSVYGASGAGAAGGECWGNCTGWVCMMPDPPAPF